MTLVISNILGGLGNQMFQYAAGRGLSLARGVPLYIDIADFRGYHLHQGFELERVFSCAISYAESEHRRAVLGLQASRIIRRAIARPKLRFMHSHHLIVEPTFNYWPGITDVTLPCYLQGYWQSERYFAKEANAIRADFVFRNHLSGKNIAVASHISGLNSVSLHVRRGDYASNPKSNSQHGTCSLAYYDEAIRYMCGHVASPSFIIFSDDLNWAKANLRIKAPCLYIAHNRGGESYNDMHLMSLCRHHIIANSSFSWWGAWLNPRKGKTVVAPRSWYSAVNMQDVDPCPEEWIRF